MSRCRNGPATLCPRGTYDQPAAGAEQPDDHPQGNQFEHGQQGSGTLRIKGLFNCSSRIGRMLAAPKIHKNARGVMGVIRPGISLRLEFRSFRSLWLGR